MVDGNSLAYRAFSPCLFSAMKRDTYKRGVRFTTILMKMLEEENRPTCSSL
ncbi:hypothetical protein PO124_09320 [Bacillus licheniformis]|nr:hypothetical protein [Bacillus licheniformis]